MNYSKKLKMYNLITKVSMFIVIPIILTICVMMFISSHNEPKPIKYKIDEYASVESLRHNILETYRKMNTENLIREQQEQIELLISMVEDKDKEIDKLYKVVKYIPSSRGNISRRLDTMMINTTDITKPSNMSIDTIKFILVNYNNLPESVAEIVHENDLNGVNAFFALAVTAHESGRTTSNLAKTRHNLFGVKDFERGGDWKYYPNYSESMFDFYKFIRTGYIDAGRTTIEQIQPKYAPPNPEWSGKVRAHMKNIHKMAKEHVTELHLN